MARAACLCRAAEGMEAMSEGYFSNLECAGGCGNLLPQRVVDLGRRHLWGHAKGCPKEGDYRPRRTHRNSKNLPPSAVVETSYARTLEMVKVNVSASGDRCKELRARAGDIADQLVAAEAEYRLQCELQHALEAIAALKGEGK